MPHKTRLIHIKIDEKQYERMQEIRHYLQTTMKMGDFTLSTVFRTALDCYIKIYEKKTIKRTKGKYVCHSCKKRLNVTQLAHRLTTLTGETEYTCRTCAPGSINP